MASADQKTEVVLPAEVLAEMPLPSDRKVTFLGGLFILALLAAAYVASEIVLPFVFAITLKLLLQPALRAVERLRVPRTIASALPHLYAIRNNRRLGYSHFYPCSHLGGEASRRHSSAPRAA
jgi:hypothetical protein